MLKISFSAQIDGINAKQDKTMSIKLGTQEMSSEDSAHIFDLMGKQLFIAIAETPIETLEVPDVLPEMKGDKTPAQRIRAILYVIWEQKMSGKKIGNADYQTFPRFYEDYMFKLEQTLKDKIK